MRYKIDNLLKSGHNTETEIDGVWCKARPGEWAGWYKYVNRIKEAWLVLKGEADILTWHKQ